MIVNNLLLLYLYLDALRPKRMPRAPKVSAAEGIRLLRTKFVFLQFYIPTPCGADSVHEPIGRVVFKPTNPYKCILIICHNIGKRWLLRWFLKLYKGLALPWLCPWIPRYLLQSLQNWSSQSNVANDEMAPEWPSDSTPLWVKPGL
jgi:hypothetical protein